MKESLYIFYLALYLSTIPFIYNFIKFTIKGKQSLKWPSNEGLIIANNSKSLKYEGIPKWLIEYQYSIDGQTYSSTNIIFKPLNYDYSIYPEKYPLGMQVTVYYNPKNHNEAVLENGFKNFTFAYLIAALVAIAFITTLIMNK